MLLNQSIISNLKKHRRELHKIPELGFNEFKTQKYLIDQLQHMGFSPKKICNTGVYVFIDLKKDKTYAFRSDIDALSITEENNIDFVSDHKGFMHACGHDGHMAILLGFAEYLSTLDKSDINHNILLLFQPAEEGPGGAKDIVDSRLLQQLNVVGIFGLHLFPSLNEGTIGSKSGGLMAQASEINIDIYGKSGHGGQPEKGIDSIQAAIKFLNSCNTIVTKQLSPFDPSLISFNKIIGGTIRNITAEHTRIEGTIRSFSKESFNKIKESLTNLAKGIELSDQVKIILDIGNGYPPVINDFSLFSILKNSLKNSQNIIFEEVNPEMLAEDFSFYQEEIPGLFYFLGTTNIEKGFTKSLHNCGFNFDEKSLEYGLESFILINEELSK